MPGVTMASGSSAPSSTTPRPARSSARRRRHHRIEIPRGFAIDEIAPAVALVGLHQRHVGLDRLLEHVVPPVDARVSLPSARSVPPPVGV